MELTQSWVLTSVFPHIRLADNGGFTGKALITTNQIRPTTFQSKTVIQQITHACAKAITLTLQILLKMWFMQLRWTSMIFRTTQLKFNIICMDLIKQHSQL